jgi:2-amino-4-hydroxy-6-hydroxymethyldihydropteridine diphosphokinase
MPTYPTAPEIYAGIVLITRGCKSQCMHSSIFIGLGANLPHDRYGPPRETLAAALTELARRGVRVVRVSPWYRSAPVPPSEQPWYFNAVAEVDSDLPADALLAELHAVEAAFGRARTVPNAARPIDLDLLDFRGEIAAGGSGRATLPHPRMAGRAFVLRPLADLAPDWRHPITRLAVADLLAALPADQVAERAVQ